jgi:hypothetical protein
MQISVKPIDHFNYAISQIAKLVLYAVEPKQVTQTGLCQITVSKFEKIWLVEFEHLNIKTKKIEKMQFLRFVGTFHEITKIVDSKEFATAKKIEISH